MSGHRHNPNAGTQNQGNALGDRSCVRQSQLYRKYESGNDIKSLLGTSNLCWNPTQTEGAYRGQKAYDFDAHQDMLQGNSDYRQPPERAPARQDYANDYGQPPKNYSNGGGNGDNSYASKSYGNGMPPQGNHARPRPFAGDEATTYSTSNNSYGGNNTTKNYGGNDNGADAYYSKGNQQRRDSFNDENQLRNQPRRNNGGSGGGGGGGGGSGGNGGGYDDSAYRNVREQASNGSSNFQSMRGKNEEDASSRSSIRTYHAGADSSRSTRPW